MNRIIEGKNNNIAWLLRMQGIYFFTTGIWPLVDITSFICVTGDKTDIWLVKTVGILITCISLSLLIEAFNKYYSNSIVFLSISSAIGLALIDIIYVNIGVISIIYLTDAVIEFLILIGWIIILTRSKRSVTR